MNISLSQQLHVHLRSDHSASSTPHRHSQPDDNTEPEYPPCSTTASLQPVPSLYIPQAAAKHEADNVMTDHKAEGRCGGTECADTTPRCAEQYPENPMERPDRNYALHNIMRRSISTWGDQLGIISSESIRVLRRPVRITGSCQLPNRIYDMWR